MAVNTRLSAPTYKIFEPDALDVMLSQHVLDPLQGGLAGAMLLNHRNDTQQGQQDFLASNEKFNQMARGLDAMEIAQKSHEARLKLAPGLMEHGTDANTIRGIEDLLTPEGILGNKSASLYQGKTAAEIAALNAKANADRSGQMITNKETYTDPGTNTTREITYKGKPGSVTMPPARAQVDPTVSTPTPAAPSAPTAQTGQIVQRAMAAVGASDPSQIQAGRDATGNYIVKNAASGKTATFDQTGKQIR